MMRAARRRQSPRLVAVCALLAGVSLAVLALPRAVAGLLMLPGDRDLVRIHDRKPVGDAALARVVATRGSGLRWADDGRAWTDLALAQLISAERRRVIRTDRDLAPVRRALVRGLAMAPANPYAWSRLAYVDYAIEGVGPGPAGVLPLAILSGPSERRLYLLRAELGMRLIAHITPLDRPLVLRQLELAWHQDPLHTLSAARASGGIDLLRRALSGSPDQLRIVEKLLARAR